LNFKSIFVIFCSAILFFIAIIIFLPFLVLDLPPALTYLQFTWPFLLILVLFFAGFNAFYFTNRQLFLLLEKEDWPALSRHLEDRIIKKGRYSPQLVRLLAKTYLLLSDTAAVMSLENKVAIAKPAIIGRNVLIFGTARILGKDISGAVRFFKAYRETAKGELREWVNWYYGFTLLLDHQYEEAGKEFSVLARVSKDGIITGLSSFFLAENLAYLLPDKKRELTEIALSGRERTQKILPERNWKTESVRLSSDIHIAAITKYLEEAGLWLYR